MQGSRIYSDFSEEVGWLRQRIAADVSSLPSNLKAVAEFYTRNRLKILPQRKAFTGYDPIIGKPVPYAAFWFADALGLEDDRLTRLSGLCLVYNSLSTTLRDDLDDPGSGAKAAKVELADYWFRRYLKALREIFPTDVRYKRTTSWAEAEWRRYNAWNSRPIGDARLRPFSKDFLAESSRYFVAVVLPTLAAIASASKAEYQVPRIERFLRHFSLAWRIFDDLMDWERDLDSKDLNRSSVLLYIQNKSADARITKHIVMSWFLSERFIYDSYRAMLDFLSRAQVVAASFRNPYLTAFMEQQIEFQTKRRDILLRSASVELSIIQKAFLAATASDQEPGSRGPRLAVPAGETRKRKSGKV